VLLVQYKTYIFLNVENANKNIILKSTKNTETSNSDFKTGLTELKVTRDHLMLHTLVCENN